VNQKIIKQNQTTKPAKPPLWRMHAVGGGWEQLQQLQRCAACNARATQCGVLRRDYEGITIKGCSAIMKAL
jgi:hypothetical protein